MLISLSSLSENTVWLSTHGSGSNLHTSILCYKVMRLIPVTLLLSHNRSPLLQPCSWDSPIQICIHSSHFSPNNTHKLILKRSVSNLSCYVPQKSQGWQFQWIMANWGTGDQSTNV
jgi:hypothetical protein